MDRPVIEGALAHAANLAKAATLASEQLQADLVGPFLALGETVETQIRTCLKLYDAAGDSETEEERASWKRLEIALGAAVAMNTSMQLLFDTLSRQLGKRGYALSYPYDEVAEHLEKAHLDYFVAGGATEEEAAAAVAA